MSDILKHLKSVQRISRIGVCCIGLFFACSFGVGCRSQSTIDTEREFQHVYSAANAGVFSPASGDRRRETKAWAVGIKEDWEFDIDSSDSQYLNRVKTRLPEYTVVKQTDNELVLSREFDGDAVTVVVQRGPSVSGTGDRIHVRVAAGPD
jgi:hypothetical protein